MMVAATQSATRQAKDGLGAYCPLGEEESQPAVASEDVVFTWNNRPCTGIPLHVAVLQERSDTVRSLLDSHPEQLTQRFTYTTISPWGSKQEGSGEAIHLAVSRNSIDIVNLLVERRAALDATVTRDHKPHYDVLHAAVFNEGRGGKPSIIRCLIDAKAIPSKNLDGHYPLHKAYQTGGNAFDAIPLLRESMLTNGLLENAEDINGPEGTALQMGIKNGKLSGEQLSQAAPLTPMALKVFVQQEPLSIRPFFERMERENVRISADHLAEHVTLADICKVLRECPNSAEVLLKALEFKPEADSPGWHPLPTRMSFAPRSQFEWLQNCFNPPPEILCFYQAATRWEFDAKAFTSPRWHDVLLSKSGKPVYDVSIKVYKVPEIVCAEFCAAALDSDHDGIFSNDVVYAVVRHVWWGGAYKVDILQLIITAIGLLLLIYERGLLDLTGSSGTDAAPSRRLRPHAGTNSAPGFGGDDSDAGNALIGSSDASVAFMFLGARGFADLAHEILQIGGYWEIGRCKDYFSFGNFMDLVRAFMAMICYLHPETGQGVQILLILLYWFRLLEVSFSEKLMRELLPIIQLVAGLAPSCVVCFIAVCAFTHAKWVMTAKPLWPNTFHESFALLITAEMPADRSDTCGLLFSYLAVCAFSVFFLNIFIGVIGENYSSEKETVRQSLLKKKCGLCMTFLLRARKMPTRLFSRRMTDGVLAISMLSMVLVLVAKEIRFKITPAPFLTLFGLQILALLACYQDPEHAFSGAPVDSPSRHRYMWVAAIDAPEEPSKTDDISQSVADLREKIAKLRKLVDRNT